MSGAHTPPRFRVDRLWPDPATDLDLDDAFADFAPPPAPAGRLPVATNMVTTIDGRAQRMGTAEGLSGRADRRLMRLYRVAYDAVGSGIGTLRATDFWSTLPADLAERERHLGLGLQRGMAASEDEAQGVVLDPLFVLPRGGAASSARGAS